MQSPLTNVDAGPDPDFVPYSKIAGKVYQEYYECVHVKEVNFGKFIGRCNTLKANLDKCNREQHEVARKKNFQASQEKQKIMEQRMEVMEAQVRKMMAEKGTGTESAKESPPQGRKGFFW